MRNTPMSPDPVRPWRILSMLAAVAFFLALGGGCATEGPSDMPWNSPQPWEGSPTIPGFQGQ